MTFLTIALVLTIIALVFFVRKEILHCFAEPILARPVLIIESDDWGPEDSNSASVLEKIRNLLLKHRDKEGRPAVFTLGMLMRSPNAETRQRNYPYFGNRELREPGMLAMLSEIAKGERLGTFFAQIHGMEHYWPSTLATAIESSDDVKKWFEACPGLEVEELPSAIQSRWTNAARLPSTDHTKTEIETAVDDEVSYFEDIFNRRPAVFVPPTFVWNDTVEAAYSEVGVNVLITPGYRNISRDRDGGLVRCDNRYWNGYRTNSGMVSLVRDIYFEPTMGHRASEVSELIAKQFSLGRPALLETHRFNFAGPRSDVLLSLQELDRLLYRVSREHPNIAFLNPLQLKECYGDSDGLVPRMKFGLRAMVVYTRRISSVKRLQKTVILIVIAVLCVALLQNI